MKKQTILSLLTLALFNTAWSQETPETVATPQATARPLPKQEETKNPSEPTGAPSPQATAYPHANQPVQNAPAKSIAEDQIAPAPQEPNPILQKAPNKQTNNTPPKQETPPEKPTTTVRANSNGSASVSAGGVTASESGLSAGSMSLSNYQIDDINYQRLSWRPELILGKLGVAFDLELILADGQVSSEGWNFDTQKDILNTLYRKIYYVRWDHPGAPFYAKLGALDNITLDAGGLISNNWGNTALYPKRKDLGVHLQINETLTPLNMSFEVLNNALQDWSNDGGIIGGKFSLTPIASSGIPILSDLRLGIAAMGDLNQYAALEDTDGDLCPNQLDDHPNNAARCVDYLDNNKIGNNVPDEIIENHETDFKPYEDAAAQKIKNSFSKGNDFYLAAIDAYLPILNTSLLALSLHSEYAKPIGDQGDLIEESWAAIPLGFNAKAFIFRFGADYLQMDKAFQLGHFDANYDKFRAQVADNRIISKEELYWTRDLGFRHGIFGRLGADLYAIDLSGQYVHLITDKKNTPNDRSFKIKAAIAPTIIKMIPKITRVEVFYNKDRLGQDVYFTENGTRDNDSFWQPSIYTVAGSAVGIEISSGMEIIWNTFYRWSHQDENGKTISGKAIISDAEYLMETVIRF